MFGCGQQPMVWTYVIDCRRRLNYRSILMQFLAVFQKDVSERQQILLRQASKQQLNVALVINNLPVIFFIKLAMQTQRIALYIASVTVKTLLISHKITLYVVMRKLIMFCSKLHQATYAVPYIRVANHSGMAGTVQELTPAIPSCPGLTRICTGIVCYCHGIALN